jgi:hypothetical protein
MKKQWGEITMNPEQNNKTQMRKYQAVCCLEETALPTNSNHTLQQIKSRDA